MKVGILSLPLNTNYGGILQAYALQTVLQRMGHEVMVFNQERTNYLPLYKQFLSYGSFLVCKYILNRDVTYKSPRRINNERNEREQFTSLFINKYIKTYKIRNIEKDIPKDIDAIIVGSDQVWRHYYFTLSYKCGIENAFLKFCEKEKLKRVAYAASFGNDVWEYSKEETKECARLLRRFDAVSVREISAVGFCQNMLGRKDAQQVLDPTMLLSKDEYIKIIENNKPNKSPGNLMCYILDETEEKKTLVDIIANGRQLMVFRVGSKVEDQKATNTERIQPPLEEWLQGFVDASFVVTDSFHACVFSILFNKPFVVIGNKFRGMSRFYSLLEMFSLSKNLILDVDEYDETYDYKVSDFAKENLFFLRNKSLSFLSQSLM